MRKLMLLFLLLPIFASAQNAKEYVEQGKAMYKEWRSRPFAPFNSPSDTIPTDPEHNGAVKAMQLFAKAIELDPDNMEAYQERVRIKAYSLPMLMDRMTASDYRSLISDYTNIIRLAPGDTTWYYQRAIAERVNGDPKAAVNDLQKLITINPKSTRKYYSEILMTYNSAGKYNESLELLKHRAELEPNYAGVYSAMAEVHRLMKNYKAALQDYDKAIALGSNAYLSRSKIKELLNDHKGALDDDLSALKLKKPNAITNADLLRLGELYTKAGELDAAIDDYTKAIVLMTPGIKKGELYKSEFKVINPYEERAKVEVLSKKYEKAMADYDTAIRYNRLPGLYNGRAELKYLIKDQKTACADWHIAYDMATKTLRKWAVADSLNEIWSHDGKPHLIYASNEDTRPDTAGYSKILFNMAKYCQ